MTDNTIEFHAPVRMGDVLRTHQVLRSVSDEKTTKLGTGRFWVIDVVYTNAKTATWSPSSPTPGSAIAGARAHDHDEGTPPPFRRRGRGRRVAGTRLPGQRHHGGPGRAGDA